MNPFIRIGIADDHPLLREGVANTLRKRADLQVVEQGGNADEARDIAQRMRPDVMLMDVNMPGDVFAAVKFISTQLPQVKVLMLTVSESEDDAYSALEAGARGYVLKGVSGPDLVLAIRSIARGETFITPEFANKLLSNFKKHEAEVRKIDLTHREEQIIREVSKGLTNKEVASKLFISEKTVKYYMTCVMQKLHARNRVEAVTALRRHWEREAVGRLHISPAPTPLDVHGGS
ncbi:MULTISPECIES: response regulator transcription factor [Pseudomonas]|uniref:Response regulator transcription factor n=1 Tax=Pseudomonas monsensis TaxID=2745509 RepID=A0ABT3YNY5_9PSED|nr:MULTISPECIES: response regulator transcription factor [Pseudomonas]PTT86832.1 DNA-binding response regulator [Pseudomonas sp. HMWF005]MCY0107204.1 response regulator transcription factor [Pseudomonas monsensis]MDZ3826156.1 response regulator transcription factor [Pseudomonas monsensis]PTS96920.1 DNA-binding response regulator [Pseudomonas sp. HMWF006]QXI02785.1 response regulator transcription factor [Pseudomonas monsensis]